MNIVDTYKSFKGQLIIFISGIAGCGKNNLAKLISDKFSLKLLKQSDYIIPDFKNITTLANNTTVNNFNTDKAFNWDKLNEDIKEYMNHGVIVTGISFPTKDDDRKIDINPDYHIHIAISKQLCIEKRQLFFEKNKEKYPEEYKITNSDSGKLHMNKLIYPYYLSSLKKMKFDEYIKANELSESQVWDHIWEKLIEFIGNYVYKFANSKKYIEWKEKNKPISK